MFDFLCSTVVESIITPLEDNMAAQGTLKGYSQIHYLQLCITNFKFNTIHSLVIVLCQNNNLYIKEINSNKITAEI